MFDSLQERLGTVFDGLRRRGALSAEDVEQAARQVRIALLEADVALPVVKDFVGRLREKAVGQEVLRSVTPGQQVVKIVNDELVEMLGGGGEAAAKASELQLRASPPTPIMLVGLQGSGKTTSCAKIALRLKDKQKKKVLMASLDTRRPAAQDQLMVLGFQAGVDTLDIVKGEPPVAITKRAMQKGALEGYDVVLLDTAGRLSIDEELMDEVAAVRDAAKPAETLLVADAMTGQDAVQTATKFHERLGLTGIVLTRVDGDSRGGAALSMRQVTGCPIKLMGVGEKLDELEVFHPERVASRILGMGDIVSLVEKARETIEQDEAEALAKKVQKGKFDLDDLAAQFRQLQKMGGMQSLLGMIPGLGKLAKGAQNNAQFDEKMIGRQLAIISSMTKGERRKPEIIKASRRQRIARGSGTTVQDVNKLLKQHQEAQRMMKRMTKMGKKGLLRNGLPGLGGGGMPGGGMPGGGMPGGGMPGGGLPGGGFPGGGMPGGFPGGFPGNGSGGGKKS